MGDLISREYMKSLGGACIAQRLKNGDLCPIISIDLLPSVEPEERTKERTETHACDFISRQAAIDAPVKTVSEGLDWIPVYHLKDLPSAEPERKKGKWNQIISIPNDMFGRYYCSECGKEGNPFWYFCPNCGADMKGEKYETD